MDKEIPFKNRKEAGEKLSRKLMRYKEEYPLVLALPRGGVLVGYQVAIALHATLDTVVARKITVPYSPEYGIGAIAPGEVLVLDDRIIASLGLTKDDLDPIIQLEMEEMERRIALYQSGVYSARVRTDTVILVDDGLATGVTAKAAIESVTLILKPRKIIFASPICAYDSAEDLKAIVDELVCIAEVKNLVAIGYWYKEFTQTSDEEVIDCLLKANIR